MLDICPLLATLITESLEAREEQFVAAACGVELAGTPIDKLLYFGLGNLL